MEGPIEYKNNISQYTYHICSDQLYWEMAEEQGFRSLKLYSLKKKEIISPDVDLAGVEHQQQLEQIEES